MSDETNSTSDAQEGVAKHTFRKRIAIIAIEILLVAVIVGLLMATWLPAIIGANPNASRAMGAP
jgi:hypothetical protein